MRLAVYGYGNLGRGACLAAEASPDAKLVGIFTRRDPARLSPPKNTPVFAADALERYLDRIDVLLLCGGSATDLPALSPALAKQVHLVESFDTHARFAAHFAAVDAAARAGGRLALVGGGWDPGLFSCARILFDALLPDCRTQTLFGPGVSQGHSNAAAGVRGLAAARAYTLPAETITDDTPPEKLHRRSVFAVPDGSRPQDEIAADILALAPYFSREDTEVRFISAEEFAAHHGALCHRGCVRTRGRIGKSGFEASFSLDLESNPTFTGAVLVACARALLRLASRGAVGAITMADLSPADLSPRPREELIKGYL